MNFNHVISRDKSKQVDLLLTNANIINVFSGEIIKGNIGIINGYIAGTGNYPAKKTIDMKKQFVAPGFIDSHVHIESSMVSVTEFAKAVLPLGTTMVVADPHEIANVLGTQGIKYMLQSAENQPMSIFYSLPSCVPATNMETSGAKLDADTLEPFMNEKKILALAEMMNYPGVIYGDIEVLKKLKLAKLYNKPIDGHGPGISGLELNAYAGAGILSDHECTTIEEAKEKLEAGIFIMIREGTGAKDLDALLPVINQKNFHRMMWCTDDRHPHDILDQGHIDYIIRKAIDSGLDPVIAVQMGTINPAQYFNIKDAGAIAPGYRADLVVFSDLNNLCVKQVYCKGILSAENGQICPELKQPSLIPVPVSVNLNCEKIDFSIPVKGNKIRVIQIIPDQLITNQKIMEPKISNNTAVSDPLRDLLKIAVIERYTGNAQTGLGFVQGIGLAKGAIASSVAHDSHNIIVTGADDNDMKTAVKAVVDMGGGMAVACNQKVLAKLALPIAGLMSNHPISMVRKQLDNLISAAQELGTNLHDPFMALGFLALPVIPELKITDKGLVDVMQFKQVNLFIK